MKANETTLQECLFFTANRLANVLRRMVNEVYGEIGVATPHIYVLILVNQYPGITISELSEKLDIAPSTCTRFVNSMARQGLVQKEQDWKTVHVSLTALGLKKTESIDDCLNRLRERFLTVLDHETSQELSHDMWLAANRLDGACGKK